MPKLDQKRVQEAVEKAFDEAVDKEVSALMMNLIDAASPVPAYFKTPEQAAGAFARGFSIACQAHDLATAIVEKKFTSDA